MNIFVQKKYFGLVGFLGALMLVYQNCSDVGFSRPQSKGNSVHTTPATPISMYDMSFQEGDDLVLVAYTGVDADNPRFLWFFKGSSIGETNAPRFDAGAAELDSEGLYAVEYYDGADFLGEAEAEVFVHEGEEEEEDDPKPEKSPPVIKEHPKNVTSTTKTKFDFSVKASGPNLKYQWLKDGKPIKGAKSSKYSKTTAIEDEAKYSVVVSNNDGSVKSKSAKLNVKTRTVKKKFSLGGKGCGKGYCAAAISGKCGSTSKDKADKICKYKGYERSVAKKSAVGIRGAKYCGPSGKHCFINQNPTCNRRFTSVTCVREE